MPVPMIPDSASGVSMTRSSPKSFWRCSVMRKTPPSLPMSSPWRITLGSFSIALRRPALRALAIVVFWVAIASGPLCGLEGVGVCREGRLVVGDLAVRLDVDLVEDVGHVGVGHRDGRAAYVLAELVGLAVDALEEVGVGDALGGEPAPVAGDRVAQLPDLDLRGDAVLGRVVG